MIADRTFKVDVAMPHARFNVDIIEGRAIVTGPADGSMMFTSFEVSMIDWRSIDMSQVQGKIQHKWTTMSANIRNRFYSPRGLYSTSDYPKFDGYVNRRTQ